MGILDVLVMGLALSADAFAVTISDAFAYRDERRSRMLMLPVAFGVFQGLMPTLGYFLGGLFASVIETYAGVVTLVILGIIGGNMIREGIAALRGGDDGCEDPADARRLTASVVLVQAVATAIDAFAVGVSLRAQAVDIVPTALIITATTFACSCVALLVGRRFGCLLGDRAEVVGGVVLVCIGLKAFLG